jgi:hypothetical protein
MVVVEILNRGRGSGLHSPHERVAAVVRLSPRTTFRLPQRQTTFQSDLRRSSAPAWDSTRRSPNTWPLKSMNLAGIGCSLYRQRNSGDVRALVQRAVHSVGQDVLKGRQPAFLAAMASIAVGGETALDLLFVALDGSGANLRAAGAPMQGCVHECTFCLVRESRARFARVYDFGCFTQIRCDPENSPVSVEHELPISPPNNGLPAATLETLADNLTQLSVCCPVESRGFD